MKQRAVITASKRYQNLHGDKMVGPLDLKLEAVETKSAMNGKTFF
jgi:hypothetical protein